MRKWRFEISIRHIYKTEAKKHKFNLCGLFGRFSRFSSLFFLLEVINSIRKTGRTRRFFFFLGKCILKIIPKDVRIKIGKWLIRFRLICDVSHSLAPVSRSFLYCCLLFTFLFLATLYSFCSASLSVFIWKDLDNFSLFIKFSRREKCSKYGCSC